MSVAISRYEPEPRPTQRLERGDGAAEIGFARSGRGTVLSHLYQRTPCRVLFPVPEPGDVPVAALLTTSGGIAGGDRIRLAVSAGPGAAALATSAAAEKIYRSLGPEAEIDVALTVAEGAWLDFLPQETILFDGARLVRRIGAELAESARLLAAEILVFGRTARGERFARGLLQESWRLRIGGRLVWADALRLEGEIAAALDRPLGFAGATALATVVYAGGDAARHLPLGRSIAESEPCRGGATLVNGVLLARFLGSEAAVVRRAVMRYAGELRAAAAGLPASLPRLWQS